MKYIEIKKIAQRLRKHQTDSEWKLWEGIRKRQLKGRKFLRQHPILYDRKSEDLNFFTPDFYCSEENLIIEVDGKIHDYQKNRDRQRQLILEAKGIRVVRIKNEDLDDIEKVLVKISSHFVNKKQFH